MQHAQQMHSNAASRDCNGIGDCKQEQTFRAQGLRCIACLPDAGDLTREALRLGRKARPCRCNRPAPSALGWRAGVPEWSRVAVVRDAEPC